MSKHLLQHEQFFSKLSDVIVDKDGNLLELRSYNGEWAHTEFYVYLAAVESWLSTFRIARKNDVVPVIYSTPQRAYFENQLARNGFQIENGMIPTPMISFWMNGWNNKQGMDTPRETKYYNRQDGNKYPNMIPVEAMYTISIWAYKREDIFELGSQIRRSFNQGIFWIKLTDIHTGRFIYAPFFWEGYNDISNMEPGDKTNPLFRREITLKSDHFLPQDGIAWYPVTRMFIQFSSGSTEMAGTMDYISGNVYTALKKINDSSQLVGSIAPGHVYVSGTANPGQPDQEEIRDNWLINPFEGL